MAHFGAIARQQGSVSSRLSSYQVRHFNSTAMAAFSSLHFAERATDAWLVWVPAGLSDDADRGGR